MTDIDQLKWDIQKMLEYYNVRGSFSENIFDLVIQFAKKNCEDQKKIIIKDIDIMETNPSKEKIMVKIINSCNIVEEKLRALKDNKSDPEQEKIKEPMVELDQLMISGQL